MGDGSLINIKNWKVILLSFLVAATFWFFKALNKGNYSARIDYPLSFIYDSDSLILTKPLPEYIQLDVSGGGWNLLRKTFTLSADPVKIRLNNPTEIKFITRASLLPEVVSQLKSININQILTDTLHINIEQLTTRKVPILLDTGSFSLKENYVLAGPASISHDSVTLTGPVSFLKEIREQKVRLDIEDIDGNVTESVDIIPDNSDLVLSNIEEVDIELPIEKLVEDQVSVPLRLVYDDEPVELFLKDSTTILTFLVPASQQDSLSWKDFDAFVIASEIAPSDSTARIELGFSPSYIHNLKATPPFAAVGYVK